MLLGILALVNLILPIMAIAKVFGDPDTVFRYPFIFRLL
ncbi:MAG: hypothetical protein MUD14_01910 [Hydrococcus sp. Prado102]|nr:hypothetical protein [Hydrococcus sp. Prado102]